MNSHHQKMIIILLLIFISLPIFADAGLKRYAIIIGANDGGEERVVLRYAVRDAQAFNRVMLDMGALDADETMLLLNPDRFRIDQAFSNIEQIINSDAQANRKELVFYYSGHSDEEGIKLQNETYTYKDLRDKIAGIDADVRIAILDSCSSGAFTRTKGGKRKPPFQIDESVQMKGYAFLTSSSETEAAQESDKIQASFFTYYLISGLRGAADTTEDGMVTLNEAYSYAYKETLEKTQKTQYGPQHPGYDIQLTGTGDLVLTDLRSTNSLLVLGEEIEGRFYIRDTGGNLVAEVNKNLGRNLEIGLSPDFYQILWDNHGSLKETRVNLLNDSSMQLKGTQFWGIKSQETIARGDIDEKEVKNDADKVRSEEDRISDFFDSVFDNTVNEDSNNEFDDIFDNDFFDDPFFDTDEEHGTEHEDDALEEPKEEARINTEESLFKTDKLGDNEISYVPIEMSLIPVLGNEHFLRWNNVSNLSLNLTMGVGYSVSGMQLSLFLNFLIDSIEGAQLTSLANGVLGDMNGIQASSFFNFVGNEVNGAQVNGILNFAYGDVDGFQGSGLANFIGKDLDGFQAAGLANLTLGEINGFQGAGLINVALGNITGFQAAGLANWSSIGLNGFQAAGLVNIAPAPSIGFQAAGLLNYSGDFSGLQAAGLVNTAGDLAGVQIGLVNVGENITGVQIGLVNISDDYNIGLPIGLINVVRNGTFVMDWWSSREGINNISLRVGSKYLYTLFTGSASFEPEISSWSYGFGYGVNFPFAVFFASADSFINFLYPNGIWENFSPERIMPTARTFIGINIAGIGAYCGFKFDFYIPGLYHTDPASSDVEVNQEFMIGLQFSFFEK